MNQDRLSALSSLNIESRELKKVDIYETIDEFASKSIRRIDFH
jgi:hypothetical protein